MPQLAQRAGQVPGVGNLLARREHGERLDAEVDADDDGRKARCPGLTCVSTVKDANQRPRSNSTVTDSARAVPAATGSARRRPSS
jgi:hypothetical protein